MQRHCNLGLGILPILLCLMLGSSVITTYVISVCNGHVYPFLPTISDTGGQEPESNVFGLLIGISSFLSLVVAVVRFLQYRFHCEVEEESIARVLCVNKFGLVLGILCSIGMAVVAAYQVSI